MKENLKKIISALFWMGAGMLLLMFIQNIETTSPYKGGQHDFKVVVVSNKNEVSLGTPDQEIVEMAKYAVSASYDGKTINSKDLVAETKVTNIAAVEGEKAVEFTFSYKNEVKKATITYLVVAAVEDAPKPMDASEAVKKTNIKAVVKSTALATPIKSGKMLVKGKGLVVVDTKGFHDADLNPVKKDVNSSKTENKNSVELTSNKKADSDVDKMFCSTNEETESVLKEVSQQNSSKEVNVSDTLNKKVEEATSKEVVDETTKFKVIIVKMANGKVINLTKSLSGDVSGASVRLRQSADGTFTDLSSGKKVEFRLGNSSTRIIDGFSTPVTVYNTSAGVYYLS